MSIQTMIFAAQEAADKGEVPTVEQMLVLCRALHEMTVEMTEFLWFDKTFEDIGDTIYLADQAAKRDAGDPQDLPGFAGTRGQLDALSLRLAA